MKSCDNGQLRQEEIEKEKKASEVFSADEGHALFSPSAAEFVQLT